jgi:5-methylcytosine-specific restriction endonuclease McrA
VSALKAAGSTRRWRKLRRFVLERDGYSCKVPLAAGLLCGAYADHVDHIISRHVGGNDHPANLRAACQRCNLSRGAGEAPTPPPRRPTTWSW